MAPAPVNTSSTLRPTRAAHRYRKGQAPAGYNEDDDEDSDEEAQEQQEDGNEAEDAARRRKAAAAAARAKEIAAAQRRDGLQVINQGQQQRQAMQVHVKTDPDALIAAAKVKKGKRNEHIYTHINSYIEIIAEELYIRNRGKLFRRRRIRRRGDSPSSRLGQTCISTSRRIITRTKARVGRGEFVGRRVIRRGRSSESRSIQAGLCV